MVMAWSTYSYLACLCFVSINAINRPVYKIVLTQKGYAQFLQYDVETPPLREFTFCTWIRAYDLQNDQSIFTYVTKSNNRVVRLWLDTGGRYMKMSIKGKVTSSFLVDVVKDVWRHVCLSYQSDYGAWALYVDSRLAACEAAQSLYGYVLPKGGSLIVGYGTADDGASNGFEGEIFGANMILTSTIERNYTVRKDPFFEQKLFSKNKVKDEDKSLNNYIVLNDLQTDEIHNNFETTFDSPKMVTTNSYIKFQTPHSFIAHDVGIKTPKMLDNLEEKQVIYFNADKLRTTNDINDLWNIVNKAEPGKFKFQTKPNSEPSGASTKNLSTISEYQTPPSPDAPSVYFDKSLETEKETTWTDSLYKLNENSTETGVKQFSPKPYFKLAEIETPPPIDKNTKVYGQWTSSKYAGTVLNYLKKINYQPRERVGRKIPPTIPLIKISDSFPYASDFKITKLRPPPQFSRRNLVEKRNDIFKRDPQINVQILENNLRSNILKMHAQTRPKQVEITSRGENKKKQTEHRFYRHANYGSFEKTNSVVDAYKPQPFMTPNDNKHNHRNFNELSIPKHKYKSVLPFLKSLEYLITDSENAEAQAVVQNKDMYTKSLASANKWHNVKSYNNDYTPRRINMELDESQLSHKQQLPTIRLKYKHSKEIVEKDDDPTIIKGRKLAVEVSNQSNDNKDSVSILKYNHGYLPTHDERVKKRPKINAKRNMDTHSFDKHIKIGNALNERLVLGTNEDQKKQSFVGGFENIPDINRYRSDIDNKDDRVPSSLGPRVCKNVELYDRVLYVQQDESIDMTHILSPVKEKNLAIEFILQNYKKCSLAESFLERNSKLFIDWSKTPVRLFGGAYPKTTTDLCGFF